MEKKNEVKMTDELNQNELLGRDLNTYAHVNGQKIRLIAINRVLNSMKSAVEIHNERLKVNKDD